MPFVIDGGLATFQALTDKVLGGIKQKYVTAFPDDVLIYAESFEECAQHITEVLRRTEEAGLMVNLAKVSLYQQSLRFLGHITSSGECRFNLDTVQVVLEYTPFPQRHGRTPNVPGSGGI